MNKRFHHKIPVICRQHAAIELLMRFAVAQKIQGFICKMSLS
jgi:hypothetical protein